MRIQIADLTCELLLPDPEFLAELESRYSAFITTAEPQLKISVQAEGIDQSTLQTWQESHAFPESLVLVEKKGEVYRIKRLDNPFETTIDLLGGEGQLRLNGNLYCFDSFLRVLYSILLAREEGILLHSASIKSGQGGYVLIGVSGSGKTTISGLAKDTVLSDELVAIRKIDGEFVLFSTPFWGEFVAGKMNAKAKLEAAYLLVKDPENFLEPVGQFKAAQEILGCTFFFGPQDHTGLVFNFCLDLASEVPVNELHFRPTGEVFDLIEKDLVRSVT